MPRITCPNTTWTKLNMETGPEQLTVQRGSFTEFWVVVADAAPSDALEAPGDAADFVMLGAEFPALQTARLSGTSLNAYARPVWSESATLYVTELL